MEIMTRAEAVDYLRAEHPHGHSRHYALEGPLTFYGGTFSNFVQDEGPLLIMNARTFGAQRSYETVEHYFQACKAVRESDHDYVRVAIGPLSAKQRGRGVRMTPERRAAWDDGESYEVMMEGLRAKFALGTEAALTLLQTGSRYIAEDSPTDNIWGIWSPIDKDWTGRNLLGEALMQRRTELRAEAKDAATPSA